MKCAICGRKLTDPLSVKREIGPVCFADLKGKQSGKEIHINPGERVLTSDMGGEIESLIRSTSLKTYRCLGLPSDHIEIVGAWFGYPHGGGLSDSSGKKWWAYQKCSQSSYEMSWRKVQAGLLNKKTDSQTLLIEEVAGQ